MVELFAIGTLWFWILISIAIVLSCISIQVESGFGATIVFIATFALLGFLGDFNILAFTKDNPGTMAIISVAYVVLGIIWSFIKLGFYVNKKNKKYLKEKSQYLKDNPDETEEHWIKINESNLRDYKLSQYKNKIMYWSTFWVWSLTMTICDDTLIGMFKWFQKRFLKVYEFIFKKLAGELVTDQLKLVELNKPLTRKEWMERNKKQGE
jgi:hypothetical protein